ncbi:IS982 family transposase [Draconibacterium mangrovi]|uniref:IS982 family transposase n=1 Tax=Draconibacterium mangrovi TaxID=2697469 RepID=UPI0013D5DE53|nr:IS982 family transposase [Draconibacterium mangrovi]
MSDCQIIAFAITGESLGIDSEAFLWAKIKTEHADDFFNLIDRSNFNRRRKRLYPFIEELNKPIASYLNEREDCFLVDSVFISVSKHACEQRSKVCKENFETAPNKGYSAVNKTWYYGHKLHLLTSASGVFHSMNLSKASVHDVHYLSQVKHSGLNNCILLGDKSYLSNSHT